MWQRTLFISAMNISNYLNCAAKNLLRNISSSFSLPRSFASGRWWPQPDIHAQLCTKAGSSDIVTTSNQIQLVKDHAAPIYSQFKDKEKKGYDLVPWNNGEHLANYVLFEDSIQKSALSWKDYNSLTSEERTIYMKHLQAIQERRLTYKDPKTGYTVFTISHHLHKGKCCGNGCRHCPYNMINASEEIRKSKVWNGAYYV